jgi:hypothetical protein
MNPTLLLTSKLQENGHRAIDMDVVFFNFSTRIYDVTLFKGINLWSVRKKKICLNVIVLMNHAAEKAYVVIVSRTI